MNTELTQFDELKSELTQLVSPALSIAVTDFESSHEAIEAAKTIKGFQKRVEAKRTELVGPLNKQVKAINEYAKDLVHPLEKAEAHIKFQLATFEEAQEKIRQAELRKAEEERRQHETELLAKQEAERAELETEDAEVVDLFGGDPEDGRDEAIAELEKKQLEEQAKMAQESKMREWEIKNNGIKNARKIWKCEVTDLSQVPKEFLIVELNQAAVLAAARGGVTTIPGVKLWQETQIAIGQNTYMPRMVK